MPKVTTSAGDDLHYRDDCFTAPWEEPKATVLLHAEGETGLAWYAWVPRLAGRGRVIRPDARGTGRSVAMRPGQAWSLDRLAADLAALIGTLELGAVHLVAARFAAPVALRLAATQASLVETLALCSACADPAEVYGERAERWASQIEREGLDTWAASVAPERLGEDAEEKDLEGWAGLLAGADREATASLFRSLPALDATGDLARIGCPTLVVTTDASAALPLEATTAWQRRIEGSELVVLNGTGDHVAASHAKDVAGAVVEFQRKSSKAAGGKRDRADKGDRGDKAADRERRREEKRRARG